MAATFASDLLQSAQLFKTVFDERLQSIGLTAESYVLLQAAADWDGRPWRFLVQWPATGSRQTNNAILQEFINQEWIAKMAMPNKPKGNAIAMLDGGRAKLAEAMAVERRLAAEVLVGTKPEGLSALAAVFAAMQENLGSLVSDQNGNGDD
ncbi:MAG: hypothetical protein C0606_03980 [Hyphomicrobiales bacterium]|nr:MAG: hypothetical protein C0606_03980 [Hyphomicrobiales bacterium]